MGLNDIISWYQRKIGTYDKQHWERTIEHRILNGYTHVPKKIAKLKTDLIDVDLVRGSSFPKAKPKHGFVTVARHAVLRLVFLPAYSRWWLQQTSVVVYAVLLFLYMLQIINMALYFYCVPSVGDDVTETISLSEVLVPVGMMFVLCIIHSHIVATHVGSSGKISDTQSRRVRRTKRRATSTSRSRTARLEKTDVGEGRQAKYVKRVRLHKNDIGSRDYSEDTRRCSVAWDLSENRTLESQKNADGNDLEQCFPQEGSNPSPRQRVRLQLNQENQRRRGEITPLDDDGFESLNGNGSSENGEETLDESCNKPGPLNNRHSEGKSVPKWNSEDFPDGPTVSPVNVSADYSELTDSNIELIKIKKASCKSIESLPVINSVGGSCESLSDNSLLIENSKTDLINTKELKQCSVRVCNGEAPNIQNDNKIHNDINTYKDASIMEVIDNEEARAGTPLRNAWVQEVLTCRTPSSDTNPAGSDTDCTDVESHSIPSQHESLLIRRKGSQTLQLPRTSRVLAESSYNSSCEESEDADTVSSPGTAGSCRALTEGTTSAGEWIGVTTNSEECSYSSEIEESDSQRESGGLRDNAELNDHPFAWEFELTSTMILNPSCAASDKVSCTVWETRDAKKADLSVLDISSAIIARVESMPESIDYFIGGLLASLVVAFLPSMVRLFQTSQEVDSSTPAATVPSLAPLISFEFIPSLLFYCSHYFGSFLDMALGSTLWERTVILISLTERLSLSILFFFLLAVAERTFKQRFLYAKLFSHLTSFRRARKSELPHFRLNKVRNIKTWLSVRSYLKKRGPQHSVDVIVSAAFLITLLLLSFLSVECLKDSVRLHSEYNLEALVWSLVLGAFLLRFMTLGTKINRKYRNLSVLITEQINLYLQIEQKPNKKEELMVANSVLKLAADLLKELESPFKISGLSANPYLYTITKVVILSALSGVLSEMLGFKLKLHKIKIK